MDTKRMAKLEASKLIAQLLQSEDMEVLDGVDFGFTEGSLLLRGAVCDIQIKLITPSAKTGTRYPKLEEDGKEVEDYSSTFFCLEFSENSKNLKFFEYLFFFKLCEFSENSKNLKFFEYLFFFKLCEFSENSGRPTSAGIVWKIFTFYKFFTIFFMGLNQG